MIRRPPLYTLTDTLFPYPTLFRSDIFDEALALFGAILLRRLHDQALHFLLRHLHAMRLADFRQEQAEAHAAHRDAAIFVAVALELGLRRFDIFLVARFMLELLPDLVELGLDHRWRTRKSVGKGKRVSVRVDLGGSRFIKNTQLYT